MKSLWSALISLAAVVPDHRLRMIDRHPLEKAVTDDMGSFAQRYVKRHGLAQPFQADFEGLSGYVRGNIGSVRSSQS